MVTVRGDLGCIWGLRVFCVLGWCGISFKGCYFGWWGLVCWFDFLTASWVSWICVGRYNILSWMILVVIWFGCLFVGCWFPVFSVSVGILLFGLLILVICFGVFVVVGFVERVWFEVFAWFLSL